MLGIAWHQAGAHAAHLTATTVHLEFRTASQRQHQLMVVVSVFMGLVVETEQASFKHGARRVEMRRAWYVNGPFFPSRNRRVNATQAGFSRGLQQLMGALPRRKIEPLRLSMNARH